MGPSDVAGPATELHLVPGLFDSSQSRVAVQLRITAYNSGHGGRAAAGRSGSGGSSSEPVLSPTAPQVPGSPVSHPQTSDVPRGLPGTGDVPPAALMGAGQGQPPQHTTAASDGGGGVCSAGSGVHHVSGLRSLSSCGDSGSNGSSAGGRSRGSASSGGGAAGLGLPGLTLTPLRAPRPPPPSGLTLQGSGGSSCSSPLTAQLEAACSLARQLNRRAEQQLGGSKGSSSGGGAGGGASICTSALVAATASAAGHCAGGVPGPASHPHPLLARLHSGGRPPHPPCPPSPLAPPSAGGRAGRAASPSAATRAAPPGWPRPAAAAVTPHPTAADTDATPAEHVAEGAPTERAILVSPVRIAGRTPLSTAAHAPAATVHVAEGRGGAGLPAEELAAERLRADALAAQVQELLSAHQALAASRADEVAALQSLLADELLLRTTAADALGVLLPPAPHLLAPGSQSCSPHHHGMQTREWPSSNHAAAAARASNGPPSASALLAARRTHPAAAADSVTGGAGGSSGGYSGAGVRRRMSSGLTSPPLPYTGPHRSALSASFASVAAPPHQLPSPLNSLSTSPHVPPHPHGAAAAMPVRASVPFPFWRSSLPSPVFPDLERCWASSPHSPLDSHSPPAALLGLGLPTPHCYAAHVVQHPGRPHLVPPTAAPPIHPRRDWEREQELRTAAEAAHMRRQERQVAAELERQAEAHAGEVALLEVRHRQELESLRSGLAASQRRERELAAELRALRGQVADADQLCALLLAGGGGAGEQQRPAPEAHAESDGK